MANLYLRTANGTTQTLLTNSVANLGGVTNKYCKKINGVKTFEFNGSGIALQQAGIYDIKVSITFTAPTAGDVEFQMYANGVPIVGASATETITTATTEFANVTLLGATLVDTGCVLGCPVNDVKTITIATTDIGATVTSIVVEVIKVV